MGRLPPPGKRRLSHGHDSDDSAIDLQRLRGPERPPLAADAAPRHRPVIGDIIAETRNLSDRAGRKDAGAPARERACRFGEAAVALGFASADDVLFALAQQFHYPYAHRRAAQGSAPNWWR